MHGCVDQLVVGLEIFIVQKDFAGLRLVQSVDLFAFLAGHRHNELQRRVGNIQQHVLNLFVVHNLFFPYPNIFPFI